MLMLIFTNLVFNREYLYSRLTSKLFKILKLHNLQNSMWTFRYFKFFNLLFINDVFKQVQSWKHLKKKKTNYYLSTDKPSLKICMNCSCSLRSLALPSNLPALHLHGAYCIIIYVFRKCMKIKIENKNCKTA